MRADADLMVYVAARWPSLVRDAVLLGVPPEQAADAVTDALSRCRREWGNASRDGDVEALMREELVQAAGRRGSTDPASREELVQAAGRRGSTDPASREEQAGVLLVLAPPTIEELTHRQRARSRASLRRAGLIAVPLLLVGAGAGAYAATRGDDPAPGPPKADTISQAAVHREENPAPGVVWYADGQLHLAHAVLAVEGLHDMTALGAGVVYGDEEGRVIYAADDGSRELLGHKDPTVPVAATTENGWAAWVDPTGDRPRLMVVEAATGNPVARTEVLDGARVVAVDGGVVFYVDSAGAESLIPDGSIGTQPINPAGLLDVRSRIRAFQVDDDTLDLLQPYFSVDYQVPGVGAALSPDGKVVVTRIPGADGKIALYDVDSGQQLADGLTEDDSVLAVAPGDDATVAYVLAPDGLTPGRELQLRTCDLRTTLCHIAARIPNNGGTPVLAR